MQVRTAILAGATGLVGRSVLRELLQDPLYGRIVALTRRPLALSHVKLEIVQTDFSDLDELNLSGDDAFCCLGTTLRAAGSPNAFRRVDYGHVVDFAGTVRRQGGKRFAVVSSLGADAGSRLLYPRTKGEMERTVAAMGFSALAILRPSLLLGDRAERRPAERAAIAVSTKIAPLLIGPLRRYRPIEAATVARAMVRLMRSAPPGTRIVESEALAEACAASAPVRDLPMWGASPLR
jgi:uncharacterized protein YbjT (DUF2867 family)